MRINFTSIKENQKIDEIMKIINEAFSKTEHKFKIVPCNYEKNKEKIKLYHQKYYQNNRDKIKTYHQVYNNKKKLQKVEKKAVKSTHKETKP